MFPSAPPPEEKNDLPPSYEQVVDGASFMSQQSSGMYIHSNTLVPLANYGFNINACKIYSPNNLILNSAGNVTNGKGTPTVTPIVPFYPEMDAKLLNEAITSNNNIDKIKILCHRSLEQRLQIANVYLSMFGKHLDTAIQQNVDEYNKILVALLQPTMAYYVSELHNAIKKDEYYLSEMLVCLSNDEKEAVKGTYFQAYQSKMEVHCEKHLVFMFYRRSIVNLLTTHRDESESNEISAALVENDVTEFIKRDGQTTVADENKFPCREILFTRTWTHINQIAKEFEKIKGYSLERMIKSNFPSGIVRLFTCILRYAEGKEIYFARCLEKTMRGWGTTDRQLIQLTINRCEIDLVDIKQEFENITKNSLKNWIRGETSAFYKYALYELIGEPKEFSYT